LGNIFFNTLKNVKKRDKNLKKTLKNVFTSMK